MYSSSDFIKSTAERDLIPIVLYTVLTDRFYFQSDAYETLWDDSLCVGNYISRLYYQRSLTTKSAAVLTKFRVRFSGHIKKPIKTLITLYTNFRLDDFLLFFFYIFLNFHYYIFFLVFSLWGMCCSRACSIIFFQIYLCTVLYLFVPGSPL